MAGEWEWATFEEAPVAIIDGDRGKNYPNQSEFSEAGHCLFLNAGNVTTSGFKFDDCAFITEEKDAALRKGKLVRYDLVLTTRGTVGNVAYFDDSVPFADMRINSGMVIFRPTDESVLPLFLYQFLRSKNFKDQVEGLRTGSAQPQLPIRDINRIRIPIPPLPEQRAIASILGALDDKIELNRRMNATLESLARAIFKSWFVDFDPVRSKSGQQAEPPSGTGAATATSPPPRDRSPDSSPANSPFTLPPSLLALFPSTFQDSDLGKIPTGWEVVPYGDLLEFENGDRGKNYPKVSEFVETGIPFINAGHLADGAVDVARVNRISEETFTNLRSGKVRPGDLLYCLRGSPGRVASVGRMDQGAIASSLVIIRPTERARTSYVYHTLSGSVGQQMAAELNNGSAQPNVSVRSLSAYAVLAPPVKVQEAFASMVEPLLAQVEANRIESLTLSTLRDTLLPKLLSGELLVPAALTATQEALGCNS